LEGLNILHFSLNLKRSAPLTSYFMSLIAFAGNRYQEEGFSTRK